MCKRITKDAMTTIFSMIELGTWRHIALRPELNMPLTISIRFGLTLPLATGSRGDKCYVSRVRYAAIRRKHITPIITSHSMYVGYAPRITGGFTMGECH
jgi:hypothetical protein